MDASTGSSDDAGTDPVDDAATPPGDSGADDSDPAACDDIRIELDYLANSAWTKARWTYADVPDQSDAAYGAINDFRIDKAGAESVHPGRSAMAILGMMEGVDALDALECDNPKRASQVEVIDAFFARWLPSLLPASEPVADGGPADSDAGVGSTFTGLPSELHYDNKGELTFTSPDVSLLGTAQVLVAMTKYLERAGTESYRDAQFELGLELANALVANIDGTTQLISHGTDAFVEENAFAALAFRNFGRWASFTTQSELREQFHRYAADIEAALQGFKHATDTNFARVRVSGGAGSYAGTIDSSGVAPYYAEVVAEAEPYAADVSAFWTNGQPSGTKLTNTTEGANYYGARGSVLEASNLEDEHRLYASSTLKLARVDWMLSQITRDAGQKLRAQNRLAFVREKSGLWYGESNTKEGGVVGGILEWRNDQTNALAPDKAKRYVDVSADFIMDVAMIDLGQTISFQADLKEDQFIEAEAFAGQQGVGTENCDEGGLHLKEVGNGDWVRYAGVSFAGVRSFEARVAGDMYNTTIKFYRGSLTGPVMATCTGPTTGGWQSFLTVSCNASNAVGSGNLFVQFTGPGDGKNLSNVNWFKLRKSYTREAERFYDQDGFMNLPDAFDTRTKKLGYAGNGDWASYDNIVFDGVTQFVVRSGSGTYPGSIEFHRDTPSGTLLGRCEMNTTGAWDSWALTSCPAVASTGTGTLVLLTKGMDVEMDLPDIDWFRLQ